jgi:hypothetical protein
MIRSFVFKLILLSFLFSPVLIFSNIVTNDDVSSLANQFIAKKKTKVNNSLKKPAPVSISSFELISNANGTNLGHLVHLSPSGFIVISNDTNLQPIVAYSLNQNWPSDTSHVLYKIVTTDLSNQLDQLSTLPVNTTTANAEKWQIGFALVDSNSTFEQWPPDGTTSTGGWLETTWHQKHPFNNFCPIDPGDNKRTLVGCIATTMAQVVNYHQSLGTLYFDNEDFYKTLSKNIFVDADSTKYDFPGFNGLNGYLSELAEKYYNGQNLNENDIAALNFACGILVEMNYRSDVSVAILQDVAVALKNKLEYQSADFMLDKDNRFYDVVIENMMNGLPAPLAISAHAIGADGYNTEGFFHLNFGWGSGIPYEITSCW